MEEAGNQRTLAWRCHACNSARGDNFKRNYVIARRRFDYVGQLWIAYFLNVCFFSAVIFMDMNSRGFQTVTTFTIIPHVPVLIKKM